MSEANEAGWERAVRYAGHLSVVVGQPVSVGAALLPTAAEKPVTTCNSSYTYNLERNSLTVRIKYELRK